MPVMTSLQLKLARTALRLGVRELAKAAGVSPSTIMRFESGKSGLHSSTMERIQKVLEDGGVTFLGAENNAGPGIRVKHTP
jgi:transcriptional regulator with XRE-family HTH domain